MQLTKKELEYIKISDLTAYERNARTHSEEQVEQLTRSIQEFGFTNPVLIDEDNIIIAGHGRTLAAEKLGIKEVPAIRLTGLNEAQIKALRIADNKLALNAGWNEELLQMELAELQEVDFDMDLIGFSLEEIDDLLFDFATAPDGEQPVQEERETPPPLSERFGLPPFSILDTRSGNWQDRKKKWIALGIDSEKGRGDDLTFNNKSFAEYGCSVPKFETSVFDPVLCEMMYLWFAPSGGLVVDPFAGGSVRGIVAAKLGREYMGIDLRQEQIDANREQWNSLEDDSPLIEGENVPSPVWHCGDSLNIDKTLKGVKADMVFSCPPYADLEKYSDDPKDLSNMEYGKFIKTYEEIIRKTCSLLKKDSFACFVVGEVRDEKGNYRGFVKDTITAFEKAGLSFYNEMILINMAGTLPMRVARAFNVSRKVGKSHQNVLVFVKGDPKVATALCGKIELPEEE